MPERSRNHLRVLLRVTDIMMAVVESVTCRPPMDVPLQQLLRIVLADRLSELLEHAKSRLIRNA
jgi:hypothetical protein